MPLVLHFGRSLAERWRLLWHCPFVDRGLCLLLRYLASFPLAANDLLLGKAPFAKKPKIDIDLDWLMQLINLTFPCEAAGF
jgi:hypothetical protein